jgi:serine/threonine-protein kinase
MVVGEDGTMMYVRGVGSSTVGDEQLVWVDREGDIEPVDPTADPADLGAARLSPDGTRVAVAITGAEGATDIWVHELPNGPRTRLTPADGEYGNPTWTEDGRSLMLRTDEFGGQSRVMLMRADGSDRTPDVVLEAGSESMFPELVPGDTGFVFAAREAAAGGGTNIMYYDSQGDSLLTLLATESVFEFAPTVSPDGRWLAYASNVTGTFEVFVRPFPDAGASRTQVSNGGGSEPGWSPDGTELFYRSLEGRDPVELISVQFQADSTFVVTARTPLFDFGPNYIQRLNGRSYDIDPTGQRFLATATIVSSSQGETAEAADIVLVQNWFEELRERLGGG